MGSEDATDAMDSIVKATRVSGPLLALETAAAFGVSLAFLLALAPSGPFSKELGACEAGAVRDVLSGNFVLPHYTLGIPVQVPPMFWWAAAFAVHLFGWNELALRAPSILATAVTSAVLYAWIASALDCRAALWSVPALLSAQYVADASRQPRMDAILVMFLTLGMVCLERALASPHKRTGLLCAAAISMGLAILTKGPLGIILPGLAIAMFLATQRRFPELFRLDVIATFSVALAIGAIWYFAAFHVGGTAFFEYQITQGLLHRFFGSAAGPLGECHNPFYYFLPRLVSGFLPWSLFYPALALIAWRERVTLSSPVVFAICWFVAVLGFFSISAGKCLVYILPLFPPLAALTGWLIARVTTRSTDSSLVQRLFDWTSLLIGGGVLIMLMVLATLFFSGRGANLGAHLHPSDKHFVEVLMSSGSRAAPGLLLWVSLWLIGGILAVVAFARKRPLAESASVALIAVAGTWFWYGFLNPALVAEQTLKPFAAILDSVAPPGVRIDYIGETDCDLAFYSKHEIASTNIFRCDKQSNDAYFILHEERLKNLSSDQRGCLERLAQSSSIDSHGARVLMIEKK